MKMCASRLAGLAAVAMVALLASTCTAQKLPNAYAALESSADFSILKLAVDATGLNVTLKDPKFVGTIFAPTNKAFVALLSKVGLNANAVLANKDLVASVLKYHVLPRAFKAANFRIGAAYRTLLGSRIQILSSGGSVFVNSYASKAKVLTADVEAPAAVIHVIDTVLVPKFGPYRGCRTVASLVGGSTRLKSLFAAVQAAGLDKLLSRRGFSGTVFAPTDAAFAKLLRALNTTLPELAKDKKLLTNVLLYHVITPGRVYASNIDNHTRAITAAVRPLRFNVDKGVKVIGRGSTATVIRADIFACKAVVHVIDTVLLPTRAGGK